MLFAEYRIVLLYAGTITTIGLVFRSYNEWDLTEDISIKHHT